MFSNEENVTSNNVPMPLCDLKNPAMADENEATSSSQSRVISNNNCVGDALNRNNYPKSKPALLPKPQISASDLRIAKAQIIQKTQVSTSAQTKFSSVNLINNSPTQQTLPPKKEIVLSPRKAPAISPKPQLPPKSKISKIENSTPPPPRPKPEITPKKFNSAPVRPPRSPKRTPKNNPFDFGSKESPTSPSDPWVVHKQKSASLARNENLNWTVKELNKNSKTPIKYYQQISSNKKTVEREIFVDKEPPTPRPRIKNKPKLNLELDLASCNLRDSVESSPNIESSCPIYATVDYSKKRNRKVQEEDQERVIVSTVLHIEEGYYSTFEGFETRRSSESSESFKSLVDSENSPERQMNAPSSLSAVNEIEDYPSNNVKCDNENQTLDWNRITNETVLTETILKIEELNVKEFEHRKNEDDGSLLNNTYNPMNNNYVSNVINNNCGNDDQSEKQKINETTPQSFLHRLVTANSLKTEEKENSTPIIGDEVKKEADKRESFLHKNETRKPGQVGSFDSFEFVTIEDVNMESTPKLKLNGTKSNDSNHQMIPHDTSQSLSPVVHDSANGKGSSESLTKLNSSDSESFGITKRFPWFGSFGKGHKKQTEKKERCASQFYTSPSNMGSDADLSERSRAISLPDIKNSGHSIETRIIHREENDWNSSISESINSGYSEENQNSDSDDDKDSVQRLDMHQDSATKTNKAFLIAKELMTSEEIFIDVLRLLNVDFRNFIEHRNHENKNSIIPIGEVCKILNHLSQLQTLNEDLLADMKKRIENWETNPKIADVIVKKGAFLKMYTSYIQNFKSQTNYLDECIAKYPKFAKEVKEFEATDRCKKLTIKHYMLKPVQRIPQYRLLLNDYLKHLEEDSVDYSDTLRALKIVCDVAEHANRSMKDGDKNGRLMHYQSLLGDFELIKPGREFIKDGSLEKMCRKTVKDRFFILLNDCLLHTTYSKNYLKIHQVLSLFGMKVSCNEEKKYPHSFTVVSITKSFILCAKSEGERRDWVDTLQKAIEDYISRQKTFSNVKLPETDSFKLGKEAPVWIQDGKVTMCQICTAEFTALFRRHHCRACGRVVCGKCVGNQAPLQYKKFKPEKVCDSCFDILLKDYEDSEDSIYEYLKELMRSESEEVHNAYLDIKSKFIKSTTTNSWRKQKFIPPRLKEVSANDSEATIAGWLNRKSRKSWKPFWYVLKEHVLYVYKASEDVLALETIPVLGYDVIHAEENIEDVDKKLIFSLTHPQQSPLVFHADTEESAERWFGALSTATKFDELPS